ncbi:inorganic pyrophosphatase precursor [Coccomyxa subellipsoidea C-169]|uniref:inorganic diphosphatase n=1 Tax=Coccomyxa subellipsoidea (strain C-169) TaxID=574566 RepID=I0YY91_COCSC|nr:inorganic pyrophosphatase precursor [Coccomyxa subellipsoidea C-169]EIE23360.1 inorganic pyrophosphatase precursor [Coccomyxa subellipsoidea C-169]|eukprot:XP_005647904.1 inorganic pyrophosphatase precursor [Coccomyxa subellipsoidea C-169]
MAAIMRTAVKCAGSAAAPQRVACGSSVKQGLLRSSRQPQRLQQHRQRSGAIVRAVATKADTYTKVERGEANTFDFRIFLQEKGKDTSAWHDVPLYLDGGLVSFVCEIPKESSAKMECATDEELTPIKQDTKKGKLRHYPYNINWNYGMLPQTWEDPAHKAQDIGGVAGDNDPVDVVEIGSEECAMGGVYAVKPLAILAMIDDGELDWKIAAIRTDDPKADLVNDVEDVEREFPGELDKIRIWFRDYKKPDGKPENQFGYDDTWQNKEFTLNVIAETHGFYAKLKSGERENTEGLSLV